MRFVTEDIVIILHIYLHVDEIIWLMFHLGVLPPAAQVLLLRVQRVELGGGPIADVHVDVGRVVVQIHLLLFFVEKEHPLFVEHSRGLGLEGVTPEQVGAACVAHLLLLFFVFEVLLLNSFLNRRVNQVYFGLVVVNVH